MTPAERADELRFGWSGYRPPLDSYSFSFDTLLPPGSVILTAEEVEEIRTFIDWNTLERSEINLLSVWLAVERRKNAAA